MRLQATTSRKITDQWHFALAESGNLGNDRSVGRGNVRDETLQAAKWLVPGRPTDAGDFLKEREVV